jgi:hypothetical protein
MDKDSNKTCSIHLPAQWQPFSKMADRKTVSSNISAYSSLRIMILVSKHTYLWTRIPIKLVPYTYSHSGSHFPKWPTEKQFSSNISAYSSLRIMMLVSKHTYLGTSIPIKVVPYTYLHSDSHFSKWPTEK